MRWTPPRQIADLNPRPDALEYEEAARNLVGGEGYCLIVEGRKYPPRYPFGFSFLLAPFVAAAHGELGSGIWAVLACAWIAIVATWWLGWLAGGPWSAAAAALLLSLSGVHVEWSRAVMSDAPSAALIAALGGWSIVTLRCSSQNIRPARGELAGWVALGVAIALAATVRTTNLLLLAPIACLVGLASGSAWRSRASRLAALTSGAASGLVPMLAYNLARFGSPFATGYGFWAPARYFEAKYVWGPAFQSADVALEGNLPFYARALVGDGTMYPRPIAILIVLGAVLCLVRSAETRRVAVVGLGFSGALIFVQLFFFWQNERFLLPALPFLLAIASSTLGWRSGPVLRMLAGVLLFLAVSSLARNRDLYAPVAQGEEVERLRVIDRLVEPNAAVIVDTNPFFFERILRNGRDRLWMPIGTDVYSVEIRRLGLKPCGKAKDGAKWIRELGTRPSSAAARIATTVREGRPAYFAADAGVTEPTGLLFGDFEIERVAAPSGITLFRLEPRAAARAG